VKPNDIILGIDFGDTIESHNNEGEKVENPRAMEVIARCVKQCRATYVISKVNPRQLAGLTKWCLDHDFFHKTNLPIQNMRFCEKRYDKGPIASGLCITHMIDDRPEVMAHMPRSVVKILFNPIVKDVEYWKQDGCIIVYSWTEIENILFGKELVVYES